MPLHRRAPKPHADQLRVEACVSRRACRGVRVEDCAPMPCAQAEPLRAGRSALFGPPAQLRRDDCAPRAAIRVALS
jgi:hypothetical protein